MLAAYLSKRESFNEAKVSGMEIAFIKKKNNASGQCEAAASFD